MQTNINNNTLEVILEEKTNFRKIQKVVTNKPSLMKVMLVSQTKSVSRNVSSDASIFVTSVSKEQIKWLKKDLRSKSSITDFLTKKLPNKSQMNIDGNINVCFIIINALKNH